MKTRCPHCNKTLRIADHYSGHKGRCPVCREKFRIPTLMAERSAVLVPEALAVSALPSGSRVFTPGPVYSEAEFQSVPTCSPSIRRPAAREGSFVPPLLPKPRKRYQAEETNRFSEPRAKRLPPALPTGDASVPPPCPKTSRSSKWTGGLGIIVESFMGGLDFRKMAFFFSMAIVIVLMSFLLLWIGSVVHSLAIQVLCGFLTVTLLFGMSGPLLGGIAYITKHDKQQSKCRISDAFAFCFSRFPSLIGGILLVSLCLGAMFLLFNGPIMLLSGLKSIGSVMVSLLFIPQFVLNVFFMLAAWTGVLVPCIIGVEDVGAFQAVGKWIGCVRKDTASLAVHTAGTYLCGFVFIGILVLVVGGAMIVTSSTQGMGWGFALADPFSGMASAGIKALSMALIALCVAVYPVVYWAVSFANYYCHAQSRLRRSR